MNLTQTQNNLCLILVVASVAAVLFYPAVHIIIIDIYKYHSRNFYIKNLPTFEMGIVAFVIPL